jgi:hypothetical protein
MVPCLTDWRDTLLAALIGRAFMVFSLYELWIFTLPETRRFFRADGMTLF